MSAPLGRHPLSAAFPSMGVEDLSALVTDIKANGLLSPVVVFEGQVLDGWHRYSACLLAGVTPRLVEFGDGDPVAFVISQNLHRRQMTSSQRAAAVVACNEWRALGSNQYSPGSATKAEALAKKAEVSTRQIEAAKTAQRAGLGEAVRDGKVSAQRAAEIAKLPREDWQAALERKTGSKTPRPSPEKSEPFDAPTDTDTPAHEVVDDVMADIMADHEMAMRIIEADDKLAEAWGEAKAARAELAQLNELYNAKCQELATMTREAKRWMRKAEALERRVAS